MKIKDILKNAIENLKQSGIEEASLKAKILLSHILGITKEKLIINGENEINDKISKLYLEKIELLKNHEPIQYIINNQEFMGFDFYVDNNVLIPQPDTENLVEEVLTIINSLKKEFKEKNMYVLDLCTGSGAIAISLSKILDSNRILVYGSDISDKALKIAEENAMQNCSKVVFLKSDIFKNINESYKFDIIVSNPPYIETKTIEGLSEEVRKEPHIALDGGEDGLYFYKQIINNAKKYLNPNGYLAFEIGYNQKKLVEDLLEKNGYKNIYSKKDLSGNDRVIIAQI